MSNKATKAPETPETTVSRATRTTEQVLQQQKADAERDRAFSPPPAAIPENGFESPAESTRLIQGTILRCVDGKWGTRDGSPLPEALLALSTTRVLQRWENNRPAEPPIVKKAGEDLPDVDELNAKIPQDKWEKGLNGLRPPWQKQYLTYLLNPADASTFTFINSTRGAQKAVETLEDRVRIMRTLRGNSVLPVVQLASAPMTTQFGTKIRPEFKIVGWREIGGTGLKERAALLIEHQTADMPGKEVAPPTLAEEMNDEIPL